MADKNSEHGIKEKFVAIQKRISSFLTKKNQIILFIITILAAALSVIDVIYVLFPEPISIALYIVAALSLFSSLPLWIRAVRLLVLFVMMPFAENNKILNTLIKDYKLRTVITALPGLGMNLIFAVFNGVIGITSRSAWNGSLAGLALALRVVQMMDAEISVQSAPGNGSSFTVRLPLARQE